MRAELLLKLYHKINIPFLKYLGIKIMQLTGRRYLVIRMDTNYLCNLKCRMCYFGGEHHIPKKAMSLDLFRKIAADVFRKTQVLYLSCGAEPLMTKNFIDFIKIAKEYRIPNISFVTNGTLLNEEKIQEIVSLGVNEVIISLDGATASTYETIRKGASFDKVTDTIRLFKKIKKQQNSDIPHIRLNYLLMKSTVSEIEPFFELIKDFGVSSVNFREMVSFETEDPDYFLKESIVSDLKGYDEIQSRITTNAKKIGVETVTSINCQKQLQKCTYKRFECLFPWFSLVVDCEGNFRPCFFQESFGTFGKDSYWDVIKGKKMKAIKRAFILNPRKSCLNLCYKKAK